VAAVLAVTVAADCSPLPPPPTAEQQRQTLVKHGVHVLSSAQFHSRRERDDAHEVAHRAGCLGAVFGTFCAPGSLPV
jgi:hypothetical protein